MRQCSILIFTVISLTLAGCGRESDFDYEKEGGVAGATWQAMPPSDSETDKQKDDE